MDDDLDELRRLRAGLVARSERLRLWSRLVRARTDLLTARLCPPSTPEELREDGLAEIADLVLGSAPAPGGGEDPAAALVDLRRARHDLARRREHLDDLVCWATAELLLAAAAPGASGPGRALAVVPSPVATPPCPAVPLAAAAPVRPPAPLPPSTPRPSTPRPPAQRRPVEPVPGGGPALPVAGPGRASGTCHTPG